MSGQPDPRIPFTFFVTALLAAAVIVLGLLANDTLLRLDALERATRSNSVTLHGEAKP